MQALTTLLERDGSSLLTMARCWLGSGPAAVAAIAEAVTAVSRRGDAMVDGRALREAVVLAAIDRLAGLPASGEEALADLLPMFDAAGARVRRPGEEPVALEPSEGPAAMRAAIGEVPVPFRQALLLVDMEGWTPGDAAAALGVPVPVLKRRLHVARMAMATLVQRRCQSKMAAA